MDNQTIGLLLVVLQSWMASTGLAVSRMAQLEDDLEKSKGKEPRRNFKAIVGFVMNVVSQPLNAVALAFISPSIMGALNSSINIVNSNFLSWLQGNKLTKETFIGCFLGIAGCVGIVQLGSGEVSDEEELARSMKFLTFWRYPKLIALFGSLFLLAGVSLQAIHFSKTKINGGHEKKEEMQKKLDKQNRQRLSFAYPIVGACLAKMSEIAIKCMGQLMLNGIMSAFQNHLIEFSISLAVCIAGSVGSLAYITRGSQMFDPDVFMPSFVACCNLIVALYGYCVGEFDARPTSDLALFSFFVALTLASVFVANMNKSSSTTTSSTSKELSSDSYVKVSEPSGSGSVRETELRKRK